MSELGSRQTLSSLWAMYAEQLPAHANERVMSAQKFAWWAGALAVLGVMGSLEEDESLTTEEAVERYGAIHREAQTYCDETLGPLAEQLRRWGRMQ